jgi:LAO/AO transport system kinase
MSSPVRSDEPRPAVTSAFESLLAGDQATLARALSTLERGDSAAEALAARLRPHTGNALVVGFTGPPGVGKSTLIAAFVAALRRGGERVAVLAVDPSSPVSGGAVLGDRTRMGAHVSDPGVYIRSVATRGQSDGLARSIPAFIDAADAAGWPIVVLETVGTGQADVEVVEFADVGVLLSVPGLGDEVQAIKAGMLELADILVVNKCDLPGADQAASQLKRMLELRAVEPPHPPIVLTSTAESQGIDELVTAVRVKGCGSDRATPEQRTARRLRRVLHRALAAEFQRRVARIEDAQLDALCARIRLDQEPISAVVNSVLAEVWGG